MDTLHTSSTLAEFVALYRRDYLPLKAPSTRFQQGHLLTWMMRELGTIPLNELTSARLRQWKDRLVEAYQPGTVRRYMDTLSAVLTAAWKDFDLLPENPLRKVRKPKEPKSRTRFLSDQERTNLLAACKTSKHPALYPAVMLALTTGGRKMEILGLHWSDLDMERQMLVFRDTKNGDTRVVPLVALAKSVLEGWSIHRRQGIAWVFPRPDGKEPLFIGRAWAHAVQDAGLSNFHFHDLRHTAASYLAMSGASLRDIAEILGHANIQMSRKYAHLTQTHTMGVIDAMVRKFLEP